MTSQRICDVTGCDHDWSAYVSRIAARRVAEEHRLCEAHHRAFIQEYLTTINIPSQAALKRENLVPCEIDLLVFQYKGERYHVYLRERAGPRCLVLEVGYYEASSLYAAVKESSTPRPLTHMIMNPMIKALGGHLQDVALDCFDENRRTYYAKLRISHGKRLVLIDLRPSDALSVGICSSVPILVADLLLEVKETG